MITSEMFDGLLEGHFEATAEMYRDDPAIEFMPKLIVTTMNDGGLEMIIVVFPGSEWNERRYEMLAEAAFGLARDKIVAAFLVSEAWMSQYEVDKVPEDCPRPSQDPN